MKKLRKSLLSLCIVTTFSVLPFGASAEESEVKVVKVSSVDEISAAMIKAQPGDTIVMRNGVWKDAAIVMEGAAYWAVGQLRSESARLCH